MASCTLLTPTSCPVLHEETAQFGNVIVDPLLLLVRQKHRGRSCLRVAITNKSRMFGTAFSSLSTVMLLQVLVSHWGL